MRTGRVEAFSDGVIAIIITIMVLEFHPPHGANLQSIFALWPTFLSYILSFINIAIYWNNHHHMFHLAEKVNGKVLWANQFLLFWLSLIPFVTAWMGENGFRGDTVLIYGVCLLMPAISYTFLGQALIGANGQDSAFARRLGSDTKGRASIALYIVGMIVAWFAPWLGLILYGTVAAIWLIPDRRFEQETGPN